MKEEIKMIDQSMIYQSRVVKVSLDFYIKMQCDVACMLRANGESFSCTAAKEMVDMILHYNSVEVEK